VRTVHFYYSVTEEFQLILRSMKALRYTSLRRDVDVVVPFRLGRPGMFICLRVGASASVSNLNIFLKFKRLLP
jgi:hypothetical protein